LNAITLLLVDDHPMVLAGLHTVLHGHPGLEVVGQASTAAEAVAMAAKAKPDVVLMDLRLPDGSGVDACREILSELPHTRVLFLTSYAEDVARVSTVLAGAAGFLLKDIAHEELVRAIQAAAEGRKLHEEATVKAVAQRVRGERGLSKQEYRVLELVVEGKTNREIGAALELSEKTVRNYLSNAFQKLGVARRSQAAAEFLRGRG
jgi:two-component system, NarL family, response regulator DevR